jgi:hypothetical protein
MKTLFPPEYPDRPEAPLLSFGPSFSQEISRSVIAAIWRQNYEAPHETEVRIAASLTMLEAFHPRDHIECMLAAQGVATHMLIMELHHRAMHEDTPPPIMIKFCSSIAQTSRTFSTLLRDLERRQAKPLPEPPPASDARPDKPPPEDKPPAEEFDNVPEQPEDVETRRDGTPGSLAAYAPKAPVEVYIPRESVVSWALGTRPKPWRQVNLPPDQQPPPEAPDVPVIDQPLPGARGPLELTERIYTGDALARFTSARLDPNKPIELINFDEEDSVVELEMISTGGDPEAEAERQAMMAAHPEGKPIVTYRYGNKKPPDS